MSSGEIGGHTRMTGPTYLGNDGVVVGWVDAVDKSTRGEGAGYRDRTGGHGWAGEDAVDTLVDVAVPARVSAENALG